MNDFSSRQQLECISILCSCSFDESSTTCMRKEERKWSSTTISCKRSLFKCTVEKIKSSYLIQLTKYAIGIIRLGLDTSGFVSLEKAAVNPIDLSLEDSFIWVIRLIKLKKEEKKKLHLTNFNRGRKNRSSVSYIFFFFRQTKSIMTLIDDASID